MANRALQAKFERSQREAREAAHLEYSKPDYNQPKAVIPHYEDHPITRIVNITRKRRTWKPEPKRPTALSLAFACDGDRSGLIRAGKWVK